MITYNTSAVKVDLVESGNYVEAGIIENCELKQVRYSISDKGNEFFEFTFEDLNGAKLVHTEYKPSAKTDEELVEKTMKQMSRIKQILCGYDEKNPDTFTFINPNDYIIQAVDFKSYCEGNIRLLGTRHVGKKVRIKAVYNDKGYVTLPKYSKYAIIEPMTMPLDKSKIRILSIDTVVRPVLTKAATTSNPFETIADATRPPVTDNLPF